MNKFHSFFEILPKRWGGTLLLLTVLLGVHAQTEVNGSVQTDTLRIPWEQRMRQTIDSLLTGEMFNTSQVGILVWDLKGDSAVYTRGARQTMRPASTMKLVPAITALDKLGTDYMLRTKLCYTGTVEGRVLNGNLVCVGGMDPLFDLDDMRFFVESVKALGVDSITGFVCADRSMKNADLLGEGWCWDDDNPVLSPLVYNRKDQFIEAFAKELVAAGIKGVLTEKSESLGKAKDTRSIICVRTHSIDQILLKMMKDSDNLFAECLFYQLAAEAGHHPATAKHSAAIIKQLIGDTGLDASNYRIADGSGLSLYNYISPELLVRLLRHAYRKQDIYRHLQPALPIAGWDGTLKNRMDKTAAFANVRAKTGTVTGIISLAGYCTTADKRPLCFAIINQGVMSSRAARAFQDKLCIALCE